MFDWIVFEGLGLFVSTSMLNIPRHVAIIMDGNRRWAKVNRSTLTNSYTKGANVLVKIVEKAIELGIKVVTAYAFSTENWNRREEDLDVFMSILYDFLVKTRDELVLRGIRLTKIGNISPFPDFVKDVLLQTEMATRHCKEFTLVLALNYGGRDELIRSILEVIGDVENGVLDKNDINEKVFANYLDTKKIGDPDFLIRTSGEYRISNFLNWQISYSEVYISHILWPDFTSKHFVDAIVNYSGRCRRLGK